MTSGDDEADRDRWVTNVVAFVLLVALIGAGVWLATSIADMRKAQDCALQGRRNCETIMVPRGEPR